MLKPYFGEFLVIPMPLELSLERCSNGCHYCFSNLNGYKAQASAQAIVNHITGFYGRKDLASKLLKNGYPICFSNRSDPFCTRNYRNAVKLCEIMAAYDIDVAFQTKTGPGIDDVLTFMPPSMWYISISFDDDSLCRLIEPGAPVISQRLATIRKIVDRGHGVNVGVNPFVPEWIKDKRRLIEDIKASGAYGVFIEGLHISAEQRRRLKGDVIAPEIIARTKSKAIDADILREYENFCAMAIDADLEVFSFFNTRQTDFWKPYQKLYKCFPIITDFINYCYREKNDFDCVDFNDFINVVGGLPKIPFKLDSYAFALDRSMKDVNLPVYATGNDLLKLFWSTPKFNVCPINHPMFAAVGQWVENENVFEIEGDLPVYMIKKSGWQSYGVNSKGEEV